MIHVDLTCVKLFIRDTGKVLFLIPYFSTVFYFSAAFLAVLSAQAASPTAPGAASGGGTTVFSAHANAFSLPAANMPLTRRLDFSVGNSFFRNPWVIAPASTSARDGLGPLLNTNACQNCHIKDGRGHPPEPHHLNRVSMLVRLSIPAAADGSDTAQLRRLGNIPEPTYGLQLQDFAVAPVLAEGQVRVHYRELPVTLADGLIVHLREPQLELTNLAYGPLHPQVETSARIAPPMIGLGLLAAIRSEELLQMEDPDDSDGDGISGRINRVWDASGELTVIGRFGWKAGQPSIPQQNAAAFQGDMGISSALFPLQECPADTALCAGLSGGEPELSSAIQQQVDFYAANLAVPARRGLDNPAVQLGWEVFVDSGCAACHTPTRVTGPSPHEWLSNQTIHPFSDLLLHDMGPGLADGRSEFLASGQEWRTPPLWGLGLTQTVGGHGYFLHDGRARSLLEAILWHGGEAAASQQAVRDMSTTRREALLAFLNSL